MSDANPLIGQLFIQLGVVQDRHVEEALALQRLTGQRLGEALISLGYVTRQQLQDTLSKLIGASSDGAARPRLGEVLLGLKYVSAAQIQAALDRQSRDGRKLGELLVELGFCTYKQVYEALSLQQRVASTSRRATSEAGEPASAAPTPGKRVLVVDDSPVALGVVSAGLSELGYDVHCFGNPFEALEQVSRVQPNIVLSDLEMPGLDGLELCRRLKSGPARALPVIILTANDDQSQTVGGLRAGADDYVNKSASMDEVAARIESVLRRAGETERMRRLFARYTSDAVVDEVLRNPGDIVLTGEKREVTLLFADVRDFTGLAESLPPESVVGILNEVLGRLADAVLTCGGTLDKFLGDGLMAIFGAPVAREDDALRATQAAKMMMSAIERFVVESMSSSAPLPREVRLGIGINTGAVVVGNIGSAQRTEYTCIGDAVNVASRLCSLAGAGEILLGERTAELIGGGALESLPPVRLKGKARPVPLFRLPWRAEHG